MKTFIDLIHRFGFMIRELNEMIHVPINIETKISWGTVILIVVLFLIADKYLRGKQLSSSELMRLVIIYMFILSVIIASYTDLGELFKKILEDRKSGSLFLVLIWVFVLTLLIGLLGTSKDDKVKMNGILGALFLPIILLILTNGGILEKDFGAIKSFAPQFKAPFSDASRAKKEEKEKVPEKLGLCFRWLDPEEVQSIINLHPEVAESAVFVHQDRDGIMKPYAFVVLVDSAATSLRKLKKGIVKFLKKEFDKEGIESYKIPYWIKFISEMPRTSDGKVDRHK
ncbi:hypothetical protein QUF72_19560, partial [Desulfobacterales bacterium HSG2]|nr:hypothetical protein [Desulfobacterales bacterium HSG2]